MNLFTSVTLIDLGICTAVGLGLFWTHDPNVLWALLIILWVGGECTPRPTHATCPKCSHFFALKESKTKD